MNITNFIPINSLQYKNNAQKTPVRFQGLKCDTVSFTAREQVTFDNVLIYHDYFDETYQNETEINTRKLVDKKIKQFKQNCQIGTTYHGIDGCPGLQEFYSKGNDAYRIIFKVIDKTLVIVACFGKENEYKNDKIINKAIQIAQSGELEKFVAQEKSKAQQEEEAQGIQTETFSQEELDRKIERKRLEGIIEDAKREFREIYLETANLTYNEYIAKKEEYIGDEKAIEEDSQLIQSKYVKIATIINSVKYENGDSESSVDDKIKKATEEICKTCETMERLIDKVLLYIKNNSHSALEEKKSKIKDIEADINSTFKEIKGKIKEISESANFNKTNAHYVRLLEIQKEFNINIKRKIKDVANLSGKETIQEIEDKLQEAMALEEQAFTTYSAFEDEKQKYEALISARKEKAAKRNIDIQPKQKNPVPAVETSKNTDIDDTDKTDKEEPLDIDFPDFDFEELDEIQSTEDVNAPMDIEYITTITTASPREVRVYRYPDFRLTPYADSVFRSIESNLSKTMLPACARDMSLLLIHQIGEKQMNNLKDLDEKEFLELLSDNMEKMSQTPEYQVAIRCTNIAFLNEILLCSNSDADKIYNLSSSQIEKLQKEVLEGSKIITLEDEFGKEFQVKLEGQPDFDDTQGYYRHLNSPLSRDEIMALIKTVVKYAQDIPEDELVNYLNTQGKYLSLINEPTTPKALKNRLLKYIFSDFDKINNTNFSAPALAQFDKERIEARINFFTSDEILDGIDF